MQIITQKSESAHWYSRDGQPQHTIIGKSTGRPRPTTIADARKNDWLPSTTSVLKCLHKPALQRWMIGQAVLAVMTATRNDGEAVDAFIDRVLNQEEQQHQEAAKARDLGSDIHAAVESCLTGGDCLPELEPYVRPAMAAIQDLKAKHGLEVLHTEKILVGDGYAGMADLILGRPGFQVVLDFKASKTLPKTEPWHEHQLQLSSYAGCLTVDNRDVFNLYISTTEPGKIALLNAGPWKEIYLNQWKPLLAYWKAVNKI